MRLYECGTHEVVITGTLVEGLLRSYALGAWA
jgi:hypothetical protein